MPPWMRIADLGFVLVFTVWACILHLLFFFNAGALWRDEASSVGLAMQPTYGAMWKALAFDPVPVLYFTLLRSWNGLGVTSDQGTRLLGLLIVGALWSNYKQSKTPLLLPLSLLAINPVVLQNGDSIRPYGLSIVLMILSFVAINKLLADGAKTSAALVALVAAILFFGIASAFLSLIACAAFFFWTNKPPTPRYVIGWIALAAVAFHYAIAACDKFCIRQANVILSTTYDGMMPTIELPAGAQGKLELTYSPWWFTIGGIVALTCLSYWLVCTFLASRRA